MSGQKYEAKVTGELVRLVINKFHYFYTTEPIQPPNRTKYRTLICLRSVDRRQRFAFMNQLGYRDMHVIALENNSNENIFSSLVGFCRMYRDPIIHPTVITGIYLQEMEQATSALNAVIDSLQK